MQTTNFLITIVIFDIVYLAKIINIINYYY